MRPHWEIGEERGLIDLQRGAKISGSGFIVFRGLGARLTRALMNFFIDVHVREHGYEEIWVPVVVNRASMTGTTQLPKFEDDMYALRDEDLFLIPTAEVPVTNLYRDEIVDASTLPRGFVAYSSCFRREAGAAGKDTRGLLRVHEFDKVEMVRYCTPEQGDEEHEKMTRHAETLLERLGLPHRRVLLSAGRHGLRRRALLRPRDLCARRGQVARGVVVQHVHGLPGSSREHPVSTGAGREAAVRVHAQRVGAGVSANHCGDIGALSAGRRDGHGAGSLAAVPGCRASCDVDVGCGMWRRERNSSDQQSDLDRQWSSSHISPPTSTIHAVARMRRSVIVVVMVLVALLLGSYILFTQRVVAELRREAQRTSEMFGEVLAAQDPDVDAASALLELDQRHPRVRRADDRHGRAGEPDGDRQPAVRRKRSARPRVDCATRRAEHSDQSREDLAPTRSFTSGTRASCAACRSSRWRRWRSSRCCCWPGRTSCRRGPAPIASASGPAWRASRRTSSGRRSPASPAGSNCSAIARGTSSVRRRSSTWVATSSASSAWRTASSAIGRPPQQADVNAAEILERVTNYFGARVPTLSHAVTLELSTSGDLPVKGDAVLIEWALEAVVKNAVDALAGRGGKIVVDGSRLPEGDVRIRVTDDGPGVPRELRRRVFEPGFTTKERGWGIGLALAHRIVAQWHKGSLTLVPTDRGARFEFIFPA